MGIFLSTASLIRKLATMKIMVSTLLVLWTASLVFAQDSAPAAPVTSVESIVEADMSANAGDPRGLNDETDVTGLIIALQQKEQQLQAALDEIARLRSWITKIKTASESEQCTMHYNMGCMYKLYKQFDKAEGEFLKALKISPNDPNIHYNLGILYEDDLGDVEAAKKHYARFIELSPNEEDRAQVQEWLSSLQ